MNLKRKYTTHGLVQMPKYLRRLTGDWTDGTPTSFTRTSGAETSKTITVYPIRW